MAQGAAKPQREAKNKFYGEYERGFSNNQDTAEQFQNQEEIKELFQQVNKREENPSLMYKIDKKFDNKLYRCVRKADKADFVMKSVPQA